mgnify:CR=1 FL=1
MAWIQLKIDTDNQHAEQLSDMLMELGSLSITYEDGKDTPIYEPNLATFRLLAQGEANLIPVYREFAADLETPVSVYLKLRGQGPSFLLESVEKAEQVGRYSFLGFNPRRQIISRGRELTLLDNGQAQARQLVVDRQLRLELGHAQLRPRRLELQLRLELRDRLLEIEIIGIHCITQSSEAAL